MTASEDQSDRLRADDLSDAYRRYAEPGYSFRWSRTNAGNIAIVNERTEVLNALIHNWSESVLTVLDIGCGSSTLPPTMLAGATRIGIDLLLERVRQVEIGDNVAAVVCGDGTALPVRSRSFDAVFLSTVFSSVLDPTVRVRIARECERVLRPGGAVIWYDMRLPNPSNRNITAISRRQVAQLFPDFDASWRTLSVIPPLARRLGGTTDAFYPWLARIPVLRSHLAGVLVKPV